MLIDHHLFTTNQPALNLVHPNFYYKRLMEALRSAQTATGLYQGKVTGTLVKFSKMSFAISGEEFKSLINGQKTSEQLFTSVSRPGWELLKLEYEDNRIIVKGDFEISDDLIFQKGETYPKEIIFDGGVYKNIIFRGGFFERLFFRRGLYNGYVSIRGGEIRSLVLLGGNFTHWLGTLNGMKNVEIWSDDEEPAKHESPDSGLETPAIASKKMLAEDPLVIGRFEIEGGAYANNIWLSGGEIDRLEIKCVSPVKIHCKPNDDKVFSAKKKMYIDRYDSSPAIKDLIISRYSNKDNFFHFSELKLNTLKFENFTNIGNITIAQVTLNDHLCLENSDLGKTSFISCDFSKQSLTFDSARITEISLAGSYWPQSDKIQSKDEGDEYKKKQKQLALAQLKKVYQGMGDMVTAATYQAAELEVYRTRLNRNSEKLNLGLNKISNNYGQNWLQAFLWILGAGVFFYFFYCLLLGFYFDPSPAGWRKLGHITGYFLEFLNPVRRIDTLPRALVGKNDFVAPGPAIAIDSIARLVNAYLIYQFIAAFRKHGKKSD